MGKVNKIKKLIKNIAHDAAEYICDYQEYDYKNIMDDIIKNYYSSYKPMYYRRSYSLYNAYKIFNTGKSVDIYFGPDFMGNQHRVSDEYIYRWMFEKGYHGGAHVIGRRIPNPIDPLGERVFAPMLYRTPHPVAIAAGKAQGPPFRKWSKMEVEQAPFQPYEYINKKLNKYDETKFNDRVRQGLELAFDKYGLII